MEEAAIEPFVDADAPNCDDHNAIQHGGMWLYRSNYCMIR